MLLAFGINERRSASWPTAPATVVGSRVIKNAVQIGGNGGITTYIGQYKIQYIVDGRTYMLWANSGWAHQDSSWIQEKMQHLPENGTIAVRYNPRNPADAALIYQQR